LALFHVLFGVDREKILWHCELSRGGGSERQRQRLQLHGFHSASRLCHSRCWKKLPLVKLSCYEVFCFVFRFILFCRFFCFSWICTYKSGPNSLLQVCEF
jgi:hypothetical protein